MKFILNKNNQKQVCGLLKKHLENKPFTVQNFYNYTKKLNVIKKELGLPKEIYGTIEKSNVSYFPLGCKFETDHSKAFLNYWKENYYIRVHNDLDKGKSDISSKYRAFVIDTDAEINFKGNVITLTKFSSVDKGKKDFVVIKF